MDRGKVWLDRAGMSGWAQQGLGAAGKAIAEQNVALSRKRYIKHSTTGWGRTSLDRTDASGSLLLLRDWVKHDLVAAKLDLGAAKRRFLKRKS